MLTVKLVSVGKLKERFYADACAEYEKRLSRYVRFLSVEVADERAPDRLSEKQMLAVKKAEGERILSCIKDEFVIALALEGKKMDSEAFAQKLDNLMTAGVSAVTFVIGGSLGLCGEVLNRADMLLSFSDFTFCHQLMRVILLEQVYRANKILAKESYHK